MPPSKKKAIAATGTVNAKLAAGTAMTQSRPHWKLEWLSQVFAIQRLQHHRVVAAVLVEWWSGSIADDDENEYLCLMVTVKLIA